MDMSLNERQVAQVVGYVFERGRYYYQTGAVDQQSLSWDPPSLSGTVEGSRPEPYQVRVAFSQEPGGWVPRSALCTCPYDGGPWCKHAAALLLASVHHPEIFDAPPLRQRIAGLSGEQAKAVLQALGQQPKLGAFIGQALDRMSGDAFGEDWHQVEKQTFREVAKMLRQAEYAGYGGVASVVFEMSEMLDRALWLVRDGEFAQAIAHLTGMTDAYFEDCDTIDDEGGETIELVDRLAAVWLDAIVGADLEDDAKQRLREKAVGWDRAASQYDGWTMASLEVAMTHGTDPDALRLEGEDVDPAVGDLVVDAWLRALDRQGDDQAYLAYALATQHHRQRVLRLIKLGRIAGAIDEAQQLTHPSDVLEVAGTLVQSGLAQEGLDLGLKSLERMKPDAELLSLLAPLADQLDHAESALGLYHELFLARGSFDVYTRLKELAGDGWPAMAADLLPRLNNSQRDSLRIAVAEGDVESAIKMLERGTWVDSGILADTARLALPSRAAWVLQFFHQRAMAIVNAGQSARYPEAAEWLYFVREAHVALGQQHDWRELKHKLIADHGKKRTLIPLIRDL